MTRTEVKETLQVLMDIITYQEILEKQHDCNDCSYACCKYRPRPGERTRINCPLWKRREP